MRQPEQFLTMQEIYLLIQPGQIAMLRFILEGYEGLAILTTLDQCTGLVRLLCPATRVHELWDLLAALASQLTCQPLPG